MKLQLKHIKKQQAFFLLLKNHYKQKKGTAFAVPRGRDDRIRTCGILVPNQALYQTEPHPVAFSLECLVIITQGFANVNTFFKNFSKIFPDHSGF